jgi:hypothetical protein
MVVPVGTAVKRQDERTRRPRTTLGSSGKAGCVTEEHEEEKESEASSINSRQLSTKSRSASGHSSG